MQIRLGPNRVGPKGMLQSLADTVKLLVKEGLTPDGADKFLFNLAPFIAMIVAMLLMAPIAFAKDFQFWDMNIGVLYVSAISSLMVISILMAGWASNNKYSLMGAMRSGAQIVSYELSAGLSVLSIVVLTGSLSINDIIYAQADGWWIFKGHIPVFISFIIFVIAVTAETNRAPFDLAEAESELTAGFHTEYSGFRWAILFLAEYGMMLLIAFLAAIRINSGLSYRILRDEICVVLSGRICERVYRMRHRCNTIPWRMDAFSYRKLGCIQSCNGLYSFKHLVLWKNLLPSGLQSQRLQVRNGNIYYPSVCSIYCW